MTSERPQGDARDQFAGLDSLLQTAARACPEAVLFRDGSGSVTAADAALYSSGLAAQLRQCGLRAGERMLLVMAPGTASILALAGVLRAGLVPVLVPCGLTALELAAHAKASAATALAGPSGVSGDGTLSGEGAQAGADWGEAYLSAAALSEPIRLVATTGPGLVDGAADFRASVIAPLGMADKPVQTAEGETILTFERGAQTVLGPMVSHRQAAIFASALALASEAGLSPGQPLLSTLVPATLAGLVAGPYAALLAARHMTLHGPFEAAAFLAAVDAEPGAPLCVPAAMGPLLHEAGLTRGTAALILMSRFASPAGFTLPPPLACERPLVDLYAFGESTVFAHRREQGKAMWPAGLRDVRTSGTR